MADEAETWHSCIGHCPLQKLCFFLFRSDKNYGCYTNNFHRLMMEKVEIGNFYCLIGDNRILFLQKCLLNSSPHFIRLLSEPLNLIGCWGNIDDLDQENSTTLNLVPLLNRPLVIFGPNSYFHHGNGYVDHMEFFSLESHGVGK